MKVKWNVDTGYVNREPPREVDIPDEDLEDLSPDEQERVIADYIEEDFRNTITWYRVEK